MTLEAWVNPQSVTAGWRDVVYKGNDNYYLESTSWPTGRPAGGTIVGGSYVEAYAPSVLAANTWSHLALTYDGTTLRLYLNGAQVASAVRSGSMLTSANPLQIGGDNIYGQYFQGRIDEVHVYNVPLTQAQIQADMNTPLVSGPATIFGLVIGP